ncbi:DUF6180 family protein [Lysobacter enzymogenes]|uniref:DUF6180 family protein n=1 Tax=Lysobacter enzymogenes TaxID=69 RepID=UPI00374A76C9
MKIASVSVVCIGLALPASGAAADFSLGYDVDRVPAAQLSVQACNAAIGRGAAALGYAVRANQDQKTLTLHVSGPRQEGRSLVAYCLAAGTQTAWVVQAFDYSGPGLSEPGAIARKVAGEIRKAIKPAAR